MSDDDLLNAAYVLFQNLDPKVNSDELTKAAMYFIVNHGFDAEELHEVLYEKTLAEIKDMYSNDLFNLDT